MRQRTDRFIVVFATTTDAMHMEQVCRAQGTPGRLVPIPQQLSAGCGIGTSRPGVPCARQTCSMCIASVVVANTTIKRSVL